MPKSSKSDRRDFSRFPFAPSQFPFFYGWVIVVACTVGIVASIPGQTMGVSVFTDYLISALDLSRLDLSSAYFYGTFTSSLFLPVAGRLYDRWGARSMVVLSSLGLGLSLFYLSQCDRIAHWLAAYFPNTENASLFSMIVISWGFCCVRFWGQGVLTMISRVTLSKWFHELRGLASGLSGAVTVAAFASANHPGHQGNQQMHGILNKDTPDGIFAKAFVQVSKQTLSHFS